MPKVGLGVWKTTPAEASQMVATAIANGYRLIDTAKQYGNEAGLARACKRGWRKIT